MTDKFQIVWSMVYVTRHAMYLHCDWLNCVQVVKVHQSTVDTYLEDIIMGAIDKTAEEQVTLLLEFISNLKLL